MKKLLALCLSLIMAFTIIGCDSDDHSGEAKTPSGSSAQKGRDYETVVDAFEEKGFTNIKLVELDDLVTGLLIKEGEVESVSVDDNVDYSPDTWYANDVEVVISYHTFPDEEEPGSEDNKPDSSEEPLSENPVDDILTVNNCEDLVAILTLKAEIDTAYSEFAETYKNKIIEFNGCITYLVNHEDYDTRYDILISAGNYVDENTANPGPVFKLADVGVYDLGISDLYLPGFISVGSNIKLRAEIESFDSNAGIFELDPVSIEAR